MKTPITKLELAVAMKSLLGTYMDGVRMAAQQGVERAVRATLVKVV